MARKETQLVRITHLARILAGPAIPFFTLPLMAAMLVAGTVSQRFIGLYESQKIFFSSAPALVLLGLLTVSLTCKFLFFSPWKAGRFGINLAHLGILVLLAGGFFTALQAREGSMVIGEKDSSATVQDYHARALGMTLNNEIQYVPFYKLKPGSTVPLPGGAAKMEIIAACKSCQIERRQEAGGDLRGMAQFMRLTPGKPALKDEENIAGITFRLSGAGEDRDGEYILFDPMPKPLEINADGQTISLLLAKSQRTLPFSLTLEDFQASNHPGTAMARAYHSDIIVKDGAVEWPVRIEMNKPLRYKGYTFFQSSFFKPEGSTKEFTVLAVVQNRAWLFPYIGTGLMALGLLIHIGIVVWRRKKL